MKKILVIVLSVSLAILSFSFSIKATGDRTVLYFVVNRFQIGKMRSIVHDVDPMAYITINDVADIFSANHDTKNVVTAAE